VGLVDPLVVGGVVLLEVLEGRGIEVVLAHRMWPETSLTGLRLRHFMNDQRYILSARILIDHAKILTSSEQILNPITG
jgi:hypothetical protein